MHDDLDGGNNDGGHFRNSLPPPPSSSLPPVDYADVVTAAVNAVVRASVAATAVERAAWEGNGENWKDD